MASSILTNQLTNCTIVISSEAAPTEKYAAEHLCSVLSKAFGKKLSLSTKATANKFPIYIGPVDTSMNKEEGLSITVSPDKIVLTGGGQRGVLYAVYEFLHRYLGVRYLTQKHTHIPAKLPEKIEIGAYNYSSPFDFRWSYYYDNTTDHEFASRLHNNTVTTEDFLGNCINQSLIGHSFLHQLPVSIYGKEHPEYFALIGGVRQAEGSRPDAQPCLTNPDVVRIVADWVIDYFDKNPQEITTAVSANDNDYYCHCDKCQALNEREGSPSGSHIAFVNAVAELVEQKHPDKFIGTLAYWHTQIPPKTLKVRHNVQIQLAIIQGCCVHGYHNPPCKENEFMGSLVKEWGKITENLYIWDYYTNFGAYDLPYPNIRSISDRVQWYHKWGAKGVFMQANNVTDGGDYSRLRNYVISRCLWEPELDSWELAEEFCRLHYSDSADGIIQHLTMIHDDAERADHHPGYYSTPKGLGITQESARKGLKIFKDAVGKANSYKVLASVLRASHCANRAAIESCDMVFDNGVYKLDLPEDFGSVVDDYLDIGAKIGVVNASESLKSDEYNSQLLEAVQGFDAVRLENETWMILALPKKNSEIVQMLHKPTNRDLLRKRWIYWAMENDYVRHSWSICEEKLLDGFGKWEAVSCSLLGESGAAITGSAGDSLEIKREIQLDSKINFTTTIKNISNDEQRVKVQLFPEFGTGIDTNNWGGGDSSTLSAYVFDSGEWIQFNKGWNKDFGPDLATLENANGNKVAFFNHESNFGVCLHFDSDWVEKPRFFWYPYMGCANLELISKKMALKPNAEIVLRYSFEYLHSWVI